MTGDALEFSRRAYEQRLAAEEAEQQAARKRTALYEEGLGKDSKEE